MIEGNGSDGVVDMLALREKGTLLVERDRDEDNVDGEMAAAGVESAKLQMLRKMIFSTRQLVVDHAESEAVAVEIRAEFQGYLAQAVSMEELKTGADRLGKSALKLEMNARSSTKLAVGRDADVGLAFSSSSQTAKSEDPVVDPRRSLHKNERIQVAHDEYYLWGLGTLKSICAALDVTQRQVKYANQLIRTGKSRTYTVRDEKMLDQAAAAYNSAKHDHQSQAGTDDDSGLQPLPSPASSGPMGVRVTAKAFGTSASTLYRQVQKMTRAGHVPIPIWMGVADASDRPPPPRTTDVVSNGVAPENLDPPPLTDLTLLTSPRHLQLDFDTDQFFDKRDHQMQFLNRVSAQSDRTTERILAFTEY